MSQYLKMLLILLVSKSTENDESPKLHNIEFLYMRNLNVIPQQIHCMALTAAKSNCVQSCLYMVAVIYISSVTNRAAPQRLCVTSLKSSIDILSACDDVYVCQKCVTICDHMCLCLNMWHGGMVWHGMA